jgi:cysteine desulfurase
MELIYLDNNATTRPLPEVLEAMRPFQEEFYGNPSSRHPLGGRARQAIDRARDQVAALVGARPDEVVFTSGGTESDNCALRGVLEARRERRHLVVTAVEHPAVLETARRLAHEGYEVTEAGVDADGALDLAALRDAVRSDSAVISVMAANNETGVIFPLDEVAAIARERGALLHCDAVQAAGRIPIDLASLPVDLLSLSGHKLHGPKGTGALVVRRRTPLAPILRGGHQEGDRRPGTENVPGIVGLGEACERSARFLAGRGWDRVAAQRRRLEEGLTAAIPGSVVNGARAPRVANTTSIRFPGTEAETLLLLLGEEGICASSGSACATGAIEPSHVLRAMGLAPAEARGSVRFSLSRFTTEREIGRVLALVPPAVERLRALARSGP